MAIEPTASQRGLPVTSARVTPTSAKAQADLGAGVLEQHDGQLGRLRGADERATSSCPGRAACLASFTAVRSEKLSSAMAKTRMPKATSGLSTSCGWRSFSMPSYSANRPPMLNSTSATTKAQK